MHNNNLVWRPFQQVQELLIQFNIKTSHNFNTVTWNRVVSTTMTAISLYVFPTW